MRKKNLMRQKKQLQNIDGATQRKGNKYDELEAVNRDLQNQLSKAENLEEIERTLKNEAYSFLLSEGLIEKFLEYRSGFHRNKHQEAAYLLTFQANLGGLWIDL